MNRYLISVLAVVLLLARPVPALITTLSVNPPNPQVGDSVQLVAEGLFPDACFALQGTNLQISGFDIDLTVEAIDTWVPSQACLFIIIPYGGTYELGQLPVGVYTVTVQESVSSYRTGGDQKTIQFAVGGPYVPPSASTPVAPVGNPILYDPRPQFTWTASTDADADDTVRYDLELSRLPGFPLPDRIVDIPDTSRLWPVDLLAAKQYRWRVISRDRFGLSTTSAEAQFRTYIPGDLNESWSATAADVVTLVNYVFKGGVIDVPICAAMLNGDDVVNTADILRLVGYQYKGAPPPVAGCHGDPIDFFPIKEGSYWIYEYDLPADSLFWQVTARTGDTATIDRSGSSGWSHGGPITVRLNGDGVDLDLSGEGWVEFYHFTPGRSWVHRDPFTCDDFGVYHAEREEAAIVTPAGTFFNCLRIDGGGNPGCSDAGTTVEWWAAGVGLVKWEEMTFTGPRYWVLKRYSIAP